MYLANSRRLLDAGADVNVIDEQGVTALHFAAKGESDEVVRLLPDAGADVDASSNKGETPLIQRRDDHNAG
ncbi:ankyrin repeat domain-containing protein [Mycobacterium attenuatum]|uniref:ankyrin repeat domain-containing protein n=1 Tax=Mycobacterium attenuatum TaxID=2341086 RepID=UPI000F017577